MSERPKVFPQGTPIRAHELYCGDIIEYEEGGITCRLEVAKFEGGIINGKTNSSGVRRAKVNPSEIYDLRLLWREAPVEPLNVGAVIVIKHRNVSGRRRDLMLVRTVHGQRPEGQVCWMPVGTPGNGIINVESKWAWVSVLAEQQCGAHIEIVTNGVGDTYLPPLVWED